MKAKNRPFIVLWLTFLLFSLLAGATSSQEIFQFLAHNIKLEILPQSVFDTRFGNNPDVPRTEKDIIALAQKLYPPLGTIRAEAATPVQECREYELGVLFAALQNPAVSDWTRREVDYIIEAAIPPLPKTFTYGHFKFYYTTNNPDSDHNVTLRQIQITAAWLESYWNKYSTNFKTPKNYISGGKEMVDVKVYYLGAGLYGETGSSWNNINLNSKLTVKNACKRRTTSAHELFHRVQYSYGYISGTARMKWLVEGTASWSQKYTNQILRDYMSRMDQGLNAPDVNLIVNRSYNACHFWVYLQKLSGTWAAIKDVWATYESNGKNAKAAVNTVTSTRLGKTFDEFTQEWVKANYIKDLTNARSYGYSENNVTRTSCRITYGPLTNVPRTTRSITNDATEFTLNGSVSPYGADYYDFPLGADLTQLQVKVTGEDTGNFSYHFIGVKNNRWRRITNRRSRTTTYKKTLTSGQWDKLVLVVAGRSKGGNYSIDVGSTLTGTWIDSFNKTWELTQSGNSITGTRDASPAGCGLTNVTGTYNAPDVTFYTDIVVDGCCSVTWTGTLDGNTITGTWTQTGGASGCSNSGSFSMTKQDAEAQEPLIQEGRDPACGKCNQ